MVEKEKSCGNCVNCFKGSSFWFCENCASSVGMPVKCSPPCDEACKNWSDDPKDYDKASDALRDFIDHFWDDCDDWDD